MTTPNPPLHDDEFDVELFARKLNNVTSKVWHKLTSPVRLLFRRPWLLVLLILLGLGAGFGTSKVVPPVYEADFVIQPNNPGDLIVITLLNDLEKAVKRHDKLAVSATLGIDERMAEALCRVQATVVWRSARKDSLTLLQIGLWSRNANDFDTLQHRIMNYVESNPHYALIRRLRQEDVAERQAQVKADLAEIDSLKRLIAVNMGPRNAGGFVYGEAPDPVKVYEAAFKLYNEKSSLSWQNAYLANFEILKPCMRTGEVASPNLLWLMAIGAGAGIVLCLLLNMFMKRKAA